MNIQLNIMLLSIYLSSNFSNEKKCILSTYNASMALEAVSK